VTNDFPPRRGGIQSFVHALAMRLPPDAVTVFASTSDGAAAFDARQRFAVVRQPTSVLLPLPAVARHAARILADRGCDTVLFGAAAPLGLLAPALRAAGARRIVGLTHGHEAGWAALPVARTLLHRIGDSTDVLTYLGEYFRVRLAAALSPQAAARMRRLAPGVDMAAFRPGAGGAAIRRRLGIGPDQPVVVCVSRMVPRKGQDTLIRAWPRVLASAASASAARGPAARGPDSAGPDSAGPDSPLPARAPVLLLVGDGPYRAELGALAQRAGVAESVLFTGPVPWADLPAYYDAGNIFAMPCRTRRRGLDVEGLGIVYLEASATGLPVLGGDSGGAPDAILDGETGYVAAGADAAAVAARLTELIGDPARAAAMGANGLAWVERDWQWSQVADRLTRILAG